MKKIWKNRYQIVEKLGTGGSGKVYKIWDIHLEKGWAMKILDEKITFIPGTELDETIDELTVLKKISHPNFPRIVDAFEEDGRKILIMDYIQGVTLEKVIEKGPMKEEEMVLILSQVCDAILYLHQNTPSLLYLDLKPSNIMIDENRIVKLIDLGSVSIKGKRGKISGSFGYASPEQVRVRKEGILLTEQSDIFSFGMVMYAMVTGNCNRLPVMETKNRYGIFIRKENPFLSVFLERILEKCTRGNSVRRYSSMREISKDLEIWKEYLKKKGKRFVFSLRFLGGRKTNRKQWYQVKSIFCTEGKHSFYIAKKIMILLICVLSLIPGKDSRADQRNEKIFKYERNEITEREKEQTKERSIQKWKDLEVVIRDYRLRKVLVRDGFSYETEGNILLEIPWTEIEGNGCKVMVECEDEGKEIKRFFLECVYRE